MRSTLLLVLLPVALTAVSAVTAGGGARVQVIRISPVTITGSGFGRGEPVRVVARSPGGRHARTVTATAAGRIWLRPKLRYDPCEGPLRVTATGARTHRVALALVPQRECALP